ncbi:MAG: hypothetical protein HY737_06880 [Candidatus Omnitrophica bacterium]|nr:hypothetical protein [Candidatus Omnitrophota bacterium]
MLRAIQRALVTTVIIVILLLAAALFAALHALQAFSSETLVGTVTTQPLSAEAFDLTYVPAASPLQRHTARLHGDQWVISGGIVKWHPWLTALGVPSYHRPRLISGQFSDPATQRARFPTVYELTPNADWVWELLYWIKPLLPFIEAVYGSSAYVYVEPGITQSVYVTPSGYLINRSPR